MSFHKGLRLEVSPEARDDIVDILAYTQKTWGTEQVAVCRRKIEKALIAIAGNVELGRNRGGLPLNHFTYLVGSHVIIFRVRFDQGSPQTVDVLRILYQRMKLSRHI